MKRFRFNKIKWDKILSAALVIVLLVGCVAGLAAIFSSKTTDVSDFEFKKGALDSAGFYVESDTSIYTKDLIECQGLVIEPDFEATGKYQVFYYGTNKAFLGSSELLDAHLDGMYEKGDTFNLAKYCRIVISPDTPTDNDGYPVEDWKIHFWEVAGYADDYKITVNKKQNVKIGVPYDMSLLTSCGFTIVHSDSSAYGQIMFGDQWYGAVIDLRTLDGDYKSLRFTNNTLDTNITFAFLTALPSADGDMAAFANGTQVTIDNSASITANIPADAVYLFVYMNSNGVVYTPDSIEFFE